MTKPDRSAVKVGDVLAGKYRVEEILGEGGMGVVVAATHIDLQERRAIKMMRPSELDNKQAVERFLREARAVVRLRSEHVAEVYDVGRLESGAPYIVMELLKGHDLSAVTRANIQLPVDQAVLYILQACSALAEAHATRIIHRDLKPANLFLTTRPDGSPCIKVLDFGISKQSVQPGGTDGAIEMTSTTDVMGSPLYMSPEQMRSSRFVDARTDVWALGAILYRLLVARPPFQASTLPEVFAQVLDDKPAPPPSTFRPDLPEGLDGVILRCLEKDLVLRIRSVTELMAALAPFGPDASRPAAALGLHAGGPSSAPDPAPISGELELVEVDAGEVETCMLPAAPESAKARHVASDNSVSTAPWEPVRKPPRPQEPAAKSSKPQQFAAKLPRPQELAPKLPRPQELAAKPLSLPIHPPASAASVAPVRERMPSQPQPVELSSPAGPPQKAGPGAIPSPAARGRFGTAKMPHAMRRPPMPSATGPTAGPALPHPQPFLPPWPHAQPLIVPSPRAHSIMPPPRAEPFARPLPEREAFAGARGLPPGVERVDSETTGASVAPWGHTGMHLAPPRKRRALGIVACALAGAALLMGIAGSFVFGTLPAIRGARVTAETAAAAAPAAPQPPAISPEVQPESIAFAPPDPSVANIESAGGRGDSNAVPATPGAEPSALPPVAPSSSAPPPLSSGQSPHAAPAANLPPNPWDAPPALPAPNSHPSDNPFNGRY